MTTAWKVVLALTFARLTMGMQFQSVPALAPYLTANGMSFAALGTLTGAYLLPGVAVALAGGWLSRTFGDARVVLAGLLMMSGGGVVGWWASSFEVALGGRIVAGAGAVCVNVLVTKMAADWFAGRPDLPTAMGVLVASWPAGLAGAAIAVPVIAEAAGLSIAMLLAPGICLLAFVALLAIWRAPPVAVQKKTVADQHRFQARERVNVTLSGLIWGSYNVAFVGVIAWLPDVLRASGLETDGAAALASVVGWTAIFSVALGGWAATRVAQPDWVALSSFAASALLLFVFVAAGADSASLWYMVALGLAMGPAAAMIMTLPVDAARPSLRAPTMGIYFALYYALMAVGPLVLGGLRDATGRAVVPLLAAAGIMLACIALWFAFRLSVRALRAQPCE